MESNQIVWIDDENYLQIESTEPDEFYVTQHNIRWPRLVRTLLGTMSTNIDDAIRKLNEIVGGNDVRQ